MKNCNELFRFKSEPTLDGIKKGLKEATGEEDFMGFNEVDDQQEYLIRMIWDGIIERDGDYIVVNVIV